MLTDKGLIARYDSYFIDDPVVQIIIRPAGDPSPRSSNCPSWQNSLQRCRDMCPGKLVTGSFPSTMLVEARTGRFVMLDDEEISEALGVNLDCKCGPEWRLRATKRTRWEKFKDWVCAMW